MPAESAPSQPAASAEPSSGSSSDYVRLHITPLDPPLLKIVVPASVLPAARNISYHIIETFPEKRYGFVDLPQMDAEKLKRNINGYVLKGTKVRVETARPEERIGPAEDNGTSEKKRRKSKDESGGSKRQKRDPDVLGGVTLKDRKVKRGWTESAGTKRKNKNKDKHGKDKEKRKRQTSKYTDQEECLLKVKMPPNAMANLPDEDARKKRKRGKSREVTVHEFEKTTKFPSFLRNGVPQTNAKPAKEFVEGKGWTDEDGNVVEEVKTRVAAAPPKRKRAVETKTAIEESDDTSSSGTSSEEESDAEESAVEPGKESESEDEDENSEDEPRRTAEHTTHATPSLATKADAARPMSSSSSKSLTIKIPHPPAPSAAQVHPLEALYKRPKPDHKATATPAQLELFSFFDEGSRYEEEEQAEQPGASVPMTPFTRQDLERRGVRSAAPTPDTAHLSRKHYFWDPHEDDANEGEAADADEDEAAQGARDKSDFQTWFWENRRELNRSWMSRRKAAAKEKRHQENKARASRAV